MHLQMQFNRIQTFHLGGIYRRRKTKFPTDGTSDDIPPQTIVLNTVIP